MINIGKLVNDLKESEHELQSRLDRVIELLENIQAVVSTLAWPDQDLIDVEDAEVID